MKWFTQSTKHPGSELIERRSQTSSLFETGICPFYNFSSFLAVPSRICFYEVLCEATSHSELPFCPNHCLLDISLHVVRSESTVFIEYVVICFSTRKRKVCLGFPVGLSRQELLVGHDLLTVSWSTSDVRPTPSSWLFSLLCVTSLAYSLRKYGFPLHILRINAWPKFGIVRCFMMRRTHRRAYIYLPSSIR